MDQFKRANVSLLSSKIHDPVTDLLLSSEKDTLIKPRTKEQFRRLVHLGWKPVAIYITSEEKIKNSSIPCWTVNKHYDIVRYFTLEMITDLSEKSCLTILIATTNKSITIPFSKGKSYPEPSVSFITKYIEEYNKGNIITDILIEYNEPVCKCDSMDKVFNCPFSSSDDSCHKPNPNNDFYGLKPKVNTKDNTITIKKIKDSWNREEIMDFSFKVKKFINNTNYYQITDDKFKDWINENL